MSFIFFIDIPVLTTVPEQGVVTPDEDVKVTTNPPTGTTLNCPSLDDVKRYSNGNSVVLDHANTQTSVLESSKPSEPAGLSVRGPAISHADTVPEVENEDDEDATDIDTVATCRNDTATSDLGTLRASGSPGLGSPEDDSYKSPTTEFTQDNGLNSIQAVPNSSAGVSDKCPNDGQMAPPSGCIWWPLEQYMDEFFAREDVADQITDVRKYYDGKAGNIFRAFAGRSDAIHSVHPTSDTPKDDSAVSATLLSEKYDPLLMKSNVLYMFRVWNALSVEYLLNELSMELGVGSDAYPQCGTITVLPAEILRPREDVYRNYHRVSKPAEEQEEALTPKPTAFVKGTQDTMKPRSNSKSNFSQSVGARILVDRLIAQITASAAFSFDYLVLVISASLLAGFGLGTDNAVIIVASMLVSPLMGPIVGATFGTFIFDRSMMKQGTISATYGLIMCIFCGFLVGITMGNLGDDYDWPTEQMTSRGDSSQLWVGVAIAIPSGVGVALSLLGSNTTSLVGVAISASLLPPLVNSGMMFGYAILTSTYLSHDVDSAELVRMAGVSFALTIINIACIYVMALLMFKIKESAPYRGKSLLFATVTRQLRHRNDPSPDTQLGRSTVPVKAFEQERTQQIGLHRAMSLWQKLQSGDIMNSESLETARHISTKVAAPGLGTYATIGGHDMMRTKQVESGINPLASDALQTETHDATGLPNYATISSAARKGPVRFNLLGTRRPSVTDSVLDHLSYMQRVQAAAAQRGSARVSVADMLSADKSSPNMAEHTTSTLPNSDLTKTPTRSSQTRHQLTYYSDRRRPRRRRSLPQRPTDLGQQRSVMLRELDIADLASMSMLRRTPASHLRDIAQEQDLIFQNGQTFAQDQDLIFQTGQTFDPDDVTFMTQQ